MALNKKLFLLLIVLIVSSLSVSAYYRELGQGCVAGDYYVPCTGECEWQCDGNGNLVKICQQAHGWCFNDDGNTCYSCDYVSDANEVCGTINCSNLNYNDERSQMCSSLGNLLETQHIFSCNSALKMCKEERSGDPVEEYSGECCPAQGIISQGSGTISSGQFDSSFDMYIDKNPSNNDEINGLTNEFHNVINANRLKVYFEVSFDSTDSDQYPSSVTLRASGDKTTNVFHHSAESSTGTLSFQGILPSGTKELKVIKDCPIDDGNKNCPLVSFSVSVECTECEDKAWAFDYDGDGYYSLFTENSNDCLPPYESNSCEGLFPLGTCSGPCVACESSIFWTSVTSDEFNNKIEKGCEASAISQDCLDADNDVLDNPETLYCEDKDNDKYGNPNKCELRSSLTLSEINSRSMKKIYDLIDKNDCDDNSVTGASKNPNSTYVLDNDRDENWGSSTKSCNDPDGIANKWQLYTDQDFDCDDDDEFVSFPKSCNCYDYQEGYTLSDNYNNDYFCYNITKESSTLAIDANSEFEIKTTPSNLKWVLATKRKDQNGAQIDFACPLNTCPLTLTTEKKCVEVGTFWSDDGRAEMGNNLCELKDENAEWSSRIAKASSFLIAVGEASKEDFVVHCDDFDNIKHTYQASEFPKPEDFGVADLEIEWQTLTNEPGNVGEGCVLIINKDYTNDISSGNKPGEDSQIVAIAVPFVQDIADNYLRIDFDDPRPEGNWLVQDSLYVHEPYKLLFILEGQGANSDSLKGWFNEIIQPNNAFLNMIRFLRSPLKHLQEIMSEDPRISFFQENSFFKFNKMFLGKESTTYFYSILEKQSNDNNKLTVKITNPEYNEAENEKLKKFISDSCNPDKGFLNNQNFDYCAGVDSIEGNFENTKTTNLVGDVVGLTIDDLDNSEGNYLFNYLSRKIRLQNNDEGTAKFYTSQKECTGTDLNTCTEKTCFEAVDCSVGLCMYDEITVCDDGTDGCCPYGCSFEDNDLDCEAVNEVIGFNVRYDNSCNDDEVTLLSMSDSVNGHASLPNSPQQFSNKICLKPDKGTFTVNSGTSCAGTEVISLYQTSDSHIGINGPQKICLSHSQYYVSCLVGTIEECNSYNIITSLTGETNAHIGEEKSYDTKICCKLIEAQPAKRCYSNSDCDDTKYCNGQETCNSQTKTCNPVTPVDCSNNNIDEIEECDYNPDGISATMDSFPAFTSQCDESIDACTSTPIEITSTCDTSCDAQCVANADCDDEDDSTTDICENDCVCSNMNTVHLIDGWNSLSFPSNTQITVNELEEQCPEVTGSIWYFESSSYKEEEVKFNPENGYWIYSKSECDFKMIFDYDFEDVSLESGWNFIGSDSQLESLNSIYRQEIVGPGWVYNGETYESTEDLIPGKGTWVTTAGGSPPSSP